MSFIGSMFSNSNGAGFDASANQGNALGAASAQQAQQLQGVEGQEQNLATNGSALAKNQLTQATGQNIQNASGMVSSQKGLNPALAARQASQNATSANQSAANQSAQLQAQTQMQGLNALSGTNLGQQSVYQGALANQNNAQATIAAGNQANQASALGGLTPSAGSILSALADGGTVGEDGTLPPAPTGDDAQFSNPTPMAALTPSAGPQSAAGQFFANMTSGLGAGSSKAAGYAGNSTYGQGQKGQGTGGGSSDGGGGGAGLLALLAKGGKAPGKVPALVSPGERYLPPAEAKKVVEGKKSAMSAGEKIPGKPKVGGAKNSYANDTVPKTLQEGGIVIPRSVTQAPDAQSQAHKFVAAHFAQKRGSLPGKKAKK